MNLHYLRSEIEQLDIKITTLLNQRAKLALQIGTQKRKLGIAIQDKQREEQVLQIITEHNTGPLSDEQIINIFKPIIATCRSIQQ